MDAFACAKLWSKYASSTAGILLKNIFQHIRKYIQHFITWKRNVNVWLHTRTHVYNDAHTHWFINKLTLSEYQRMLPSHTTPPCDCLALGRCKHTHTYRAMRTHFPKYQIDPNTNRSDIDMTNTESRWGRDAEIEKETEQNSWGKDHWIPVRWATKLVLGLTCHSLTCVLEVQQHAIKVVTQFKCQCRYSLLIRQLLKSSSSTPLNSIPFSNKSDQNQIHLTDYSSPFTLSQKKSACVDMHVCTCKLWVTIP